MTRRSLFSIAAAMPLLRAQDDAPARAAGEKWLALIDQAKYKDAWKQANQNYKSQTTAAEWEGQIRSMRGAAGTLKERKFTASRHSKTVPGAPDGDYTILEFSTAFEKKAKAMEILVLSQERGAWAVAGYSVV